MVPNPRRQQMRLKLVEVRKTTFGLRRRLKRGFSAKLRAQLTRFRRRERELSKYLHKIPPLWDPTTKKGVWTDTSRFRHSVRAYKFERRGTKWKLRH